MSQAQVRSPIEEVVDFFARGPSREEIAAFRLSDAAHKHLQELLDKNSSGVITQEESRELDQMTLLDDIVSLIRARGAAQSIHHLP